jgi:23S rRNA (cytidine1920-2'-O)/16S rRNA (cytidine1409-2'-O)-methyltransferase
MRRRADLVLAERGLVPSRQKARALIQEGAVTCNGHPVRKPGQLVRPDDNFNVDKTSLRWASRGGLKLEHALETFSLPSLSGRVCLDLGASTGGFTDVLLSYGAAFVYAVDIGHGQLSAHLAADKRVKNLEKTHAKELNNKLISQPLYLVVCDVSFISVTKALGPALSLVQPGGWLVSLIKPQFEAGRNALGKGGVVRTAEDRTRAIELVRRFLESQMDWQVNSVIDSPISGPDGNQEYLIAAQKLADQ